MWLKIFNENGQAYSLLTAYERFKKLALASKLNVKHQFGQSIKEVFAYRAAIIRREQEPSTSNYENEPFKEWFECAKNFFLEKHC